MDTRRTKAKPARRDHRGPAPEAQLDPFVAFSDAQLEVAARSWTGGLGSLFPWNANAETETGAFAYVDRRTQGGYSDVATPAHPVFRLQLGIAIRLAEVLAYRQRETARADRAERERGIGRLVESLLYGVRTRERRRLIKALPDLPKPEDLRTENLKRWSVLKDDRSESRATLKRFRDLTGKAMLHTERRKTYAETMRLIDAKILDTLKAIKKDPTPFCHTYAGATCAHKTLKALDECRRKNDGAFTDIPIMIVTSGSGHYFRADHTGRCGGVPSTQRTFKPCATCRRYCEKSRGQGRKAGSLPACAVCQA